MKLVKLCLVFYSLICLFIIYPVSASDFFENPPPLMTLFPLEGYSQSIEKWIPSNTLEYKIPLISKETQNEYMHAFFAHYFGSNSPWNPEFMSGILTQDFVTEIENIIQKLKPGYGENFRPYPTKWLRTIQQNMNISQFDNLDYNNANRAIATENLFVRVLPTDDVYFYGSESHPIPGQGYPFDILQHSAIWIGTPLYVIGETKDRAWVFVRSDSLVGWVKASGVGYVNNRFVRKWSNTAKKKLAAITKTKTSLTDTKGKFLTYAYVGTILPAKYDKDLIKLLIPIKDRTKEAKIQIIHLSKNQAAIMPLSPNRMNFSRIISTLVNRPYGWGNLYFYNDCSAELKNLFTPFGVWLPRHSTEQIKAGRIENLTDKTPNERINHLINTGTPFFSLIHIGGNSNGSVRSHIFMYIGKFKNIYSKNYASEYMAMTYQNIWGLTPNPPNTRAVIGKSLFFPLLPGYPENSSLVALAAEQEFQISDLTYLISDFLIPKNKIHLKDMIYPEHMR